MKPVSPEDISALFDSELTPVRAEEVRRVIVEDKRLRRIYEQMAETDSALISFAAACTFEPRLSLPNASPVLGLSVFAVALILLMVRILAKVLPFGPGIWVQASVIALFIAWLLYRFLPTLEVGTWQIERELRLRAGPC